MKLHRFSYQYGANGLLVASIIPVPLIRRAKPKNVPSTPRQLIALFYLSCVGALARPSTSEQSAAFLRRARVPRWQVVKIPLTSSLQEQIIYPGRPTPTPGKSRARVLIVQSFRFFRRLQRFRRQPQWRCSRAI